MKQSKKKFKQIAAMLLALAMLVTSMPQYALTVSAAEVKEDVVVTKEHVEAETAAKTETQLQMAQTSEQEEDADAVKETKTEAEADDTKTAETEVKTENVSETDDVAKTEEVETEVKTQQEAEEVKTEKNETDDVLKDEGDGSNSEDTVEKVAVSINIPYRELDRRGNKKEILLQSFQYALFDAEQTGDITLNQTYDASLFEDMLKTGEEITIDVPVGKILYFQPVLQDKCDMDSVKYTDSTLGTITEKDGIYMLPKMEETHLGQTIGIRITAYRCFDVEFKAEGAKFYLSLEDIQNQNPTTKCEVSEQKNTIFYVVPEENKVIKAVDSNSTRISVSREKGKYSDYNASMCTIEIKNYLTFKDTTIISAVAEELNTYKATFDWSAEEADVFVDDGENNVALSEKLSEGKMDITEGDSLTLYVKPKNGEKGVYVEYIDETSKETIVPRSEYDAETGEYSVYICDEEGISGDISVKISVVDICNVTLKAVSNYISGGYYRYGTNEEESFEFPSVDEENSESMERESETKIKLPAGYELKIWGYDESEYGTITASAENTEVTRKRGEEEYYFSLTPTADTTVVLDVAPAKFKVDADAGVEFSISRYNDDAGAYVDVALSDDNSIDYYYNWEETYLKIKKEAGKRYDVRAEVDDGDGGTRIEYVDFMDSISGDAEEEYALYELNIGSHKKVFIKSYDIVTLNVKLAEDCGQCWVFQFLLTEEDGVKSWNTGEAINNDGTAMADKNEAFFIGVRYNYDSKLDYISTTGDAGGNLEFYEKYMDDSYNEWQIYKIVPTADTTINIKVSELEYYTVTVRKGSGVKEYYSQAGYMTSEEQVFENQLENSTFSLETIELEDKTNVLKVEYEVDGGTKQSVKASINLEGFEECHIKVTGNITIYLDAVPAEDYTLTFENTDGFNVKIWESGSYNSFESPKSLTDNRITLKNDREYLFDIEPEDQYIVESVIATDASGKEILVEKSTNGDETKEGYLIGTGYGNTGNLTVKVNLKAAYRLNFELPADSGLEIYSWADQERIGNETIAVAATDSYSFYIPEYDAQSYKMSIRESDSYTLTTDYRMIEDNWGDAYRYAVYTVAPKSGVTQPSATATVVIEENDDTYAVTLVNEASEQTKGVYLAYYSSADGYSESYKLTDNKANVTNSVYNTVEVNPMRGYTAKVTMTGQSGTSRLELVKNESGLLVYGIGELTEDKTITVTVERDTVSTYYTVGFATRNAVIRDPKYQFPYLYGEYWSDDNYDCSWEYMIAKGNSISFIVEPDYGYKVERVSIRDEVITPDENGIYTVKVARDETTIIVRTVTADTPDHPDNPDDPTKKTSTVTFTCPENAVVTVDGVKPGNNQLNVETGTQISFQVEVTDTEYEIKSVTADGAEIPYDAAAGTYTITINADTEIIITTALKQGGNEPKDKFTVRFDYPENGLAGLIYKYKDVEGSEFTSLDVEGSSGTLTVEAVTTILFQPVCDEGYRGVAKVNGNEVSRDVNAFSYSLTVNENTVVVIETIKNAESETNYPTQVKVQNVLSNNQMNLPVISAKQEITLTPSDADGSVLGVKVDPEDSVIKASVVSETKGGRTKYYLQLERPETSVGDKAEITIYNTKTGEAIEGGTFTVITRKTSTGDDPSNNEGLKISFVDFDEEETPSYTYTGSAIVPSIDVTYNGAYLEAGTDYTVKCANNINVSTDAKPAKITITGKGSLSGKHEYTFQITPKDIGAAEVKAGSVKVVRNAKATPVLAYNGVVLSKKDYDNQNANDKFTTSGKITLKGKGNFKGTREINVEVVEKTALNKISIKLDSAKNKNLAYDGTAKYPVFDVFDAQKNKITDRENSAYIVVYPEDVVSAGTVKFTVIGIGDYTGSITKSYKIKPSAKTASEINISDPSTSGYPFVSTGVTAYEPSVTLQDNTRLERGRDYTLAYSNNKKAGTAKCKISFIGNYKGVKAITKEFTINPFNIADFDEENIIVADQLAGGKPSVPYVIDNVADALVKSSEFKFTYYSDAAASTEIAGKDIKKLQSGKVWVKLAPKKPSGGNYTGEKIVSYTVRENGTDLSKAKIIFNPNKVAYTGEELIPDCLVNGTSIKDNNNYSVRYLNNINKGKATVIITGAVDSEYVGSKTATFTITASDIK